jgi:hypothetical protein
MKEIKMTGKHLVGKDKKYFLLNLTRLLSLANHHAGSELPFPAGRRSTAESFLLPVLASLAPPRLPCPALPCPALHCSALLCSALLTKLTSMRIVTWNINGISTILQYHPWCDSKKFKVKNNRLPLITRSFPI